MLAPTADVLAALLAGAAARVGGAVGVGFLYLAWAFIAAFCLLVAYLFFRRGG